MSTLAWHVALCGLVLASGLQGAVAGGNDLSDFSNNLAQDLGPLLALLGEPVTRQYLSESTTFIDYFIFALCPLGIFTAVTAAIRACGHPPLRALIGRSKEGNGIVEAELCTSTSRDVCELFNNGGITRVLGRPNDVLEFVCVFPSTTSSTNSDGPKLFLFRDYLKRSDESQSEWKKLGRSLITSSESGRGSSNDLAPKPNLSLNLGSKRRAPGTFIALALFGLFLQVGIIVFAGVGAWILGWNTYSPRDYAPAMFFAGTILLCIGMGCCAALVGYATEEVSYQRQGTRSAQRSMLFWLQPGTQVVGDQHFDPFAHMEDPSKPLDSWISSSRKREVGKKVQYYTYGAVASTILGYILQFIGLRGLKAWISITQLAMTLLMSFLRGVLRVRRFDEAGNPLDNMIDMVSGHELDWMAFEIASTLSPYNRSLKKSRPQPGRSEDSNRATNEEPRAETGSRTPSWQITGQPSVKGSDNEVPFAEGNAETSLITTCQSRSAPSYYRHLFSTRVQLARLTGNLGLEDAGASRHQTWKDDLVLVRSKAKKLALAVGEAAKVLLQTQDGSKDKSPEPIKLRIPTASRMDDGTFCKQEVHVDMRFTTRSGWKVDSAQMEALLGLWMWSLRNNKRLVDEDETGNQRPWAEDRVESMQIISASLDGDSHEHQTDGQYAMDEWLGPDGPKPFQYVLSMKAEESCGHEDLWISSPSEDDAWKKFDGHLQPNSCLPLHRFFGWNVVYKSLGFSPFGAPNKSGACGQQNVASEGPVQLKIRAARTTGSLLDTCAIQVFSALVSFMGSFEGLDAMTADTTRVEHDGKPPQQENPTITGLARTFEDCGLGTRSDALLVLVPALRDLFRPKR